MRMTKRKVDGGKLRALRVTTGVHMRQVAAAAGCSWRHLQMIETAKEDGRQPSPELLHRLLKELGRLHGRVITVDEVSTEDDTADIADAA